MTVQEKNIRFDKLQAQADKLQTRADKMQSALCKVTGMLEAYTELHREEKQYKEAIRILKDLMYIHKDKPLIASKEWLTKWAAIEKEVYKEWGEHMAVKTA